MQLVLEKDLVPRIRRLFRLRILQKSPRSRLAAHAFVYAVGCAQDTAERELSLYFVKIEQRDSRVLINDF
jgi:hypothetical protein